MKMNWTNSLILNQNALRKKQFLIKNRVKLGDSSSLACTYEFNIYLFVKSFGNPQLK